MTATPSAPAAPRPLPPVVGSVPDAARVTFRWDTVPDATGYHLQVAPRTDFNQPLLDTTVPPTTSHTPEQPLLTQADTLFWRIRAQRPDGPTTWSSPQPVSAAAYEQGEAPVRYGRTSTPSALLWIGVILLSFGITMGILYWTASQMW